MSTFSSTRSREASRDRAALVLPLHGAPAPLGPGLRGPRDDQLRREPRGGRRWLAEDRWIPRGHVGVARRVRREPPDRPPRRPVRAPPSRSARGRASPVASRLAGPGRVVAGRLVPKARPHGGRFGPLEKPGQRSHDLTMRRVAHTSALDSIGVDRALDQLRNVVRAKGLKSSAVRDAVARVALAYDGHFTVEDLVKTLRETGVTDVHPATVYRVLPLLVEAGLIQETWSPPAMGTGTSAPSSASTTTTSSARRAARSSSSSSRPSRSFSAICPRASASS